MFIFQFSERIFVVNSNGHCVSLHLHNLDQSLQENFLHIPEDEIQDMVFDHRSENVYYLLKNNNSLCVKNMANDEDRGRLVNQFAALVKSIYVEGEICILQTTNNLILFHIGLKQIILNKIFHRNTFTFVNGPDCCGFINNPFK